MTSSPNCPLTLQTPLILLHKLTHMLPNLFLLSKANHFICFESNFPLNLALYINYATYVLLRELA